MVPARSPCLASGLALALSACLGGCGEPAGPVRDLDTRALVVGIDGADWVLLDALIAEGRLPHLAALERRGVRGPLETLHDIPLSPVIWTSMATGKTAAKHGITWFLVDRPDGTRVPVRSHNRKVAAIWNILDDFDRRAVSVGWWATHPAEDVGNGTIVSDGLGVHGFGATARDDDDSGKTHPSDLFETVSSLMPAERQISTEFVRRFVRASAQEVHRERFDPGRFPRPDPGNPIHLFQQYAATAHGYTAVSRHLLSERSWDLFLVYFEQVDSFSHLFMKYDPPRLPWVGETEFDRYRDVVREWYVHQDEMLGELLAEIDLDEVAVFVVSDHGFKTGERRIRSEETVDVRRAHLDHETHGVLLAAGPHLRSGAEVEGASVLDLTPTLLHYLGFPVAKDMDGRVVEDLFTSEFREANPIRWRGTYEDRRRSRPAASVSDGAAPDAAALEAGLRTLGYLGDGADSAEVPAETADPADESSPEIHNNLGRIHLRNGELARAREEFLGALGLDPRNAEALLNLARVEGATGNLPAAEQLVQRALAADPSSVGALTQLAELRRDRGDLADAIRLFEEALALDDSQPFVHLGYGDVLQRAGRLDRAESAFRLVLELDPDSFKARYNLGVTLSRAGRLDEAIAAYEESLEVGAEHPEASKSHNNLGAIHLDRGETEAARERFERAIAVAPGHLEPHYNLALIHIGAGRHAEALPLLEHAAALAPNHPQVQIALGRTLRVSGRSDDASRSFLLVRRLHPESWEAALGLAAVLAERGEAETAEQLLTEALERGGEAARAEAAADPVLAAMLVD